MSDLDRRKTLLADGFLVLPDRVPGAVVAALRCRMAEDLPRLSSTSTPPLNFAAGHIQHPPPTAPPWLFDKVFAPVGVPEMLPAVLGPGPYCGMYTGNTNMPGSCNQPVHVDDGQLWPEMSEAAPPHALVVNIFLDDVSEDNGPTEVWPGTHRDVRMTRYSRSAIITQELGPGAEPEPGDAARLCGPAGTVTIRDVRVWHRARPNMTAAPRILVTTLFFASWYAGRAVQVPRAAAAFFDRLPLNVRAEFDDAYVDHLRDVAGFDGPGRHVMGNV